jgi:formate dehydrogenase subunit delta
MTGETAVTPEKLVRMANQIGAYFAADPHPEHARLQIAEHIKKFWAPSMRRTLVESLEQGDTVEPRLDALVAQAVREHRALLVSRSTVS